MSMVQFLTMNEFLRRHRLGLLFALLVGVVSVAPRLFFIVSLGDEYRGVPIFQTPNEPAYLAIMQEIRDGHPLAAAFSFFEYKDTKPLLPPTLAFFYAAAAVILHLPLIYILLASQFFLPAFLSFLAYLLLLALQGGSTDGRKKFYAIAGGVAITLGMDLISYQLFREIVQGAVRIDNFLIWTRPVNPIGGALLLFCFLWSLAKLISLHRKRYLWVSSVAFALMIGSYVFSWTLALAVLGSLGLFALIRREYSQFRSLVAVGTLGTLLASPYWYLLWSASRASEYAEASGRIGLTATHAPVFNKFLLAVAFVFAAAWWWRRRYPRGEEAATDPFPLWERLSLALIVSGVIAYNQQVVTGMDIGFHHYVFYTIPFGYLVGILLLSQVLAPRLPRVALCLAFGLILASFLLGISVQAAVYKKWNPYYRDFQENAAFLDFLNTKARSPCVVLQNSRELLWQNLIPAFTHCDLYISGEIEAFIPRERLLHNYLALLRLRGITSAELPKYLQDHLREAHGLLRSEVEMRNDTQFIELSAKLPEYYRLFLQKDFRTELAKYRLDYLLAITPIPPTVLRELGNPPMLLTVGERALYDLRESR